MRYVAAAFVVLLCVVAVASGQASPPTFDAASVKSSRNADAPLRLEVQPGRLVATNIPLRMLIRDAYDLREVQIVGGPAWATGDFDAAERFDIQATFPANTPEDRVMEMMRGLLQSRFHLRSYFEERDTRVYALQRNNGNYGGRGLVPLPPNECAERIGPPQPGPVMPAAPRSDAGKDDQAPCGVLSFGFGKIVGHGVSVAQLADALSHRQETGDVDRPVVDRTTLPGAFDVKLEWSPLAANGGDGMTLFTAIREQLGLKLEPVNAPVRVFIIDHVERPSED